MTRKERELLLKDLCARLPYGIKGLHRGEVHTLLTIDSREEANACIQVDDYEAWFLIDDFKPYLRPMSSMTEEEKEEFESLVFTYDFGNVQFPIEHVIMYWDSFEEVLDWLNKHHFDYRGLIPMGLALEALDGMYKTE